MYVPMAGQVLRPILIRITGSSFFLAISAKIPENQFIYFCCKRCLAGHIG